MAPELGSQHADTIFEAHPESVDPSPRPPFIPREIHFTKDQIVRFKNTLDVHWHKPLHKNTDYEDDCLKSIASDRTDTLILGAHLIDLIFWHGLAGRKRPDAIEVDVTDPNSWILKHLYEFKSGKNKKSTSKINGFAGLMKELREDEAYLPSLLRRALPEDIPLPQQIVVPPDSQIDLTFISPRGDLYHSAETEFTLHNAHFPPLEETLFTRRAGREEAVVYTAATA